MDLPEAYRPVFRSELLDEHGIPIYEVVVGIAGGIVALCLDIRGQQPGMSLGPSDKLSHMLGLMLVAQLGTMGGEGVPILDFPEYTEGLLHGLQTLANMGVDVPQAVTISRPRGEG